MSNVVSLKKFKRESERKRAEGKTLCASGFHKWQLLAERRFDVHEGKLVSTEECARCGERRVKLT